MEAINLEVGVQREEDGARVVVTATSYTPVGQGDSGNQPDGQQQQPEQNQEGQQEQTNEAPVNTNIQLFTE